MKMYIIDSFTEEKFRGNPAAVTICTHKLSEREYINISGEMNLSETAFVRKRDGGEYDLRWFTPSEEINLCGHATLASAHILWEKQYESKETKLTFHSKSGLLRASYDKGWITLDFPSIKLKHSEGDESLFKAIPGDIETVLENELSYLLVLKDENQIREMKPDFDLLWKTRRKDIIVTALSKSTDCDFVSRDFCPAMGINEDPVTGSAHCCLAPYWSGILDRKELIGYQASKRGGYVRCEIEGDRVLLKGKACTVLSGDITL